MHREGRWVNGVSAASFAKPSTTAVRWRKRIVAHGRCCATAETLSLWFNNPLHSFATTHTHTRARACARTYPKSQVRGRQPNAPRPLSPPCDAGSSRVSLISQTPRLYHAAHALQAAWFCSPALHTHPQLPHSAWGPSLPPVGNLRGLVPQLHHAKRACGRVGWSQRVTREAPECVGQLRLE